MFVILDGRRKEKWKLAPTNGFDDLHKNSVSTGSAETGFPIRFNDKSRRQISNERLTGLVVNYDCNLGKVLLLLQISRHFEVQIHQSFPQLDVT